ncbi:MAG: OmpH family outer membrane protein [Planctomycetota bacterium]
MHTLSNPLKNRLVQAALVVAVLIVGIPMLKGGSALIAQDAGSPTAVATVDLNAVITQSKGSAAQEQVRAGREAQRQEEGTALNERVQKLRADLDLLAPGSQARLDKEKELRELAVEAQVWQQVAQAEEQASRSREFLQLYEAANDAVAAVARDRGVDVVLTAGQLPDLAQLARADAQQIAAILQNRKVLFNSETVDITQAVLARMNANFDAAN